MPSNAVLRELGSKFIAGQLTPLQYTNEYITARAVDQVSQPLAYGQNPADSAAPPPGYHATQAAAVPYNRQVFETLLIIRAMYGASEQEQTSEALMVRLSELTGMRFEMASGRVTRAIELRSRFLYRVCAIDAALLVLIATFSGLVYYANTPMRLGENVNTVNDNIKSYCEPYGGYWYPASARGEQACEFYLDERGNNIQDCCDSIEECIKGLLELIKSLEDFCYEYQLIENVNFEGLFKAMMAVLVITAFAAVIGNLYLVWQGLGFNFGVNSAKEEILTTFFNNIAQFLRERGLDLGFIFTSLQNPHSPEAVTMIEKIDAAILSGLADFRQDPAFASANAAPQPAPDVSVNGEGERERLVPAAPAERPGSCFCS